MNKVVVAFVLIAIAGTAPAGAAEDHPDPDLCKNHPTMTLADYLARARDDTNGSGRAIKRMPDGAYRLLVPRGLKIEKKMAHYFASNGPADEHDLPDNGISGIGGLRFLGDLISPCRVQDPAGQWWIVYDAYDALEYFRAEDLQEYEPPPPAKKRK